MAAGKPFSGCVVEGLHKTPDEGAVLGKRAIRGVDERRAGFAQHQPSAAQWLEVDDVVGHQHAPLSVGRIQQDVIILADKLRVPGHRDAVNATPLEAPRDQGAEHLVQEQ